MEYKSMWTLFYNLIKDFGVLGVVLAQFIFIVFVGWKFCTNHLKHIKDAIEENIDETKCIKKEIITLKERVAKIEGKLE